MENIFEQAGMKMVDVIDRTDIGSSVDFDMDRANDILIHMEIDRTRLVNIVHESGRVYAYYWTRLPHKDNFTITHSGTVF